MVLKLIYFADGLYILWKTMETRIKLAYALARQWFGVYITAASPNDGKMLFMIL